MPDNEEINEDQLSLNEIVSKQTNIMTNYKKIVAPDLEEQTKLA